MNNSRAFPTLYQYYLKPDITLFQTHKKEATEISLWLNHANKQNTYKLFTHQLTQSVIQGMTPGQKWQRAFYP